MMAYSFEDSLRISAFVVILLLTSTVTWSSDQASDLFRAAYDGDILQVRQLIAEKVDVIVSKQ